MAEEESTSGVLDLPKETPNPQEEEEDEENPSKSKVEKTKPVRRRLLRLSSDHLAQMGPETALVEFISASAAFFGVKKQPINQLEADLLKVSPGNVMPANAAAWYMGKKNVYANASGPNLLSVLLKHYPKKFKLDEESKSVEFLDLYYNSTAKKKLDDMVEIGLISYFTHKANEFGLYFFDPKYYEATEPYAASLTLCVGFGSKRNLFYKAESPKVSKENDEEKKGNNLKKSHHKTSVVDRFFAKHPNLFTLKRLSNDLATLSKASEDDHEMLLDQTAIIVSMVDNKFGLVQFKNGDVTEKALFSAKALFNRGKPFDEDPLKMPPVKFDGFRVKPGSLTNSKNADCQYNWFAVLVWVGPKPNPKHCVSRDELASSPYFRDKQPIQRRSGHKTAANASNNDNENLGAMRVGEVLDIRANGAVVSLEKEGEAKAFIPGWANTNISMKGVRFLVTTQGVELTAKDLIAYYVEPNSSFEGTAEAVGCNVMVLKHGNGMMGNGQRTSITSGHEVQAIEKHDKPDGSSISKSNSKKRGKNDRRRSVSRSDKNTTEESEEESDGRNHKDASAQDRRGRRGSGTKVHYAQFLLTEALEDEENYDSDVDRGYDPARDPKAIELLCGTEDHIDFDEYSDGEISSSEFDALIDEAKEGKVDIAKLREALDGLEINEKPSDELEVREVETQKGPKENADPSSDSKSNDVGEIKEPQEAGDSNHANTSEEGNENKEAGAEANLVLEEKAEA